MLCMAASWRQHCVVVVVVVAVIVVVVVAAVVAVAVVVDVVDVVAVVLFCFVACCLLFIACLFVVFSYCCSFLLLLGDAWFVVFRCLLTLHNPVSSSPFLSPPPAFTNSRAGCLTPT